MSVGNVWSCPGPPSRPPRLRICFRRLIRIGSVWLQAHGSARLRPWLPKRSRKRRPRKLPVEARRLSRRVSGQVPRNRRRRNRPRRSRLRIEPRQKGRARRRPAAARPGPQIARTVPTEAGNRVHCRLSVRHQDRTRASNREICRGCPTSRMWIRKVSTS